MRRSCRSFESPIIILQILKTPVHRTAQNGRLLSIHGMVAIGFTEIATIITREEPRRDHIKLARARPGVQITTAVVRGRM